MTAVLTAPRRASAPSASSPPHRLAALACQWRLLRRGALLMWLSVAAYMTVEILSYRSAYPDAASRAKLVQLSDATAVRMMQGVPRAIDTAAGFAVWDGGWMLSLILACWAVLTATRLTRGEEDSGRAELLLSRPITPAAALRASYAALGIALVGVGGAAALPFVLLGEPVAGAVLWGAGLAAFGAVMAALGAVCAQVVEPRRRAVSLGLAVTTVAFLVRIAANSADRRGWLLGFSPFGWIDQLHAFSGDRWVRLAVPCAVSAVLAMCALAARERRDAGAALVRGPQSRRPRETLLGGALAFGWRLTSGALIAWALILAVSNVVFGLMVGAIIDFVESDETYRKLLEAMGMDMSSPVIGFLSYMALVMALPVAAFVAWRIGAVRQEEAEGRLESLLVRGVVRWRWLAATTVLALVAALGVIIASAFGLWLGARLTDVPVTVAQVAEPMAGVLPLVVLFLGLTVLTFGVAPRLTVALPVTLAVVGYLTDTFGRMLEWPNAVLVLSPYHHLPRLPAEPMTFRAVVVLVVAGLCFAVVGIAAFCRRDVQGG
jgi:ABC-2 type transport system permease protein